MRQHLAGMQHHEAQHLVFLRRQLHVLVRHPDLPADEVDRQALDLEDRPFALHREPVAQGSAQTRQELVPAERLRDEVVGAEVEGLDLPRLVAAARQDHHGDRVVAPADDAEQFMSLHVRKAEVEDDEVHLLLPDHVQCRAAVAGLQDLVALRRQPRAQQLPDGWLVVDDQDAGGGHAMAFRRCWGRSDR